MDEQLLEKIDAKLGALLALAVDDHLRALGSGTRSRSIDAMLSAAGLSTQEIAKLLGKMQRAVQMAIRAKPTKRRSR